MVYGGDSARGVQVLDNLVFRTMTVLADGGGIYLAGNQGSSFASGAVVRGNVVHDTITSCNFGLYVDYGASWVTVQGDVVLPRDDLERALAADPAAADVVANAGLEPGWR